MVSPLSRLQSLFPGHTPKAMPPRIIPPNPEQSRALSIANAKHQLEMSRGRPAPSTAEKIPSAFHHGVAGKVWFLPIWDSATQDTPEIRAAMRFMRRDGYVKAAWEPQILSVGAESWQIQPSEPGNPEAEEQGKFIRIVIEDYFNGGMLQLVRAVCSALGSDGHSVSEKVWQYAERGRLQGKIILEKAKTKDTSESGFGVIRIMGDNYGNVTQVQCRRTSEYFSITDFIYARYLTVFDEPLGEAAFRPAYGPYWMRDTVRKLRIIHTEKKMSGMLVGTYATDDDKSPMEIALQKAKTATWLTIPEGTRVEAVKLSTASEPDYKSFDESLRDEIVTSIAFATLQQLVGGGGQDVRGDAEVQKKISDLGPWLLMTIVMDVLNSQVIPDLIDFNFPYAAAGGYPKLTFGSISSKEILEQQQLVVEAMAVGLKPSKKHYAKDWSIQLADPHDPDDEMKPAAPAGGAPGQPGAPGASPPGAGGADKPPVNLPFKFSEEVRGRVTLDDVMKAMVGRLGWPSCLKFAEDKEGHEHKGKGEGGGEFTGKGGGGSGGDSTPPKTPATPHQDRSPLHPEHVVKAGKIEPIEGLAPDDAAIQQKSLDKFTNDYPKLREQYLDPKAGNASYDDKGKLKSVTLNVDDWRHLFEGYTGTNALATHVAAGAANRALLGEMLDEQKGKGNKTVMIMAGGGGSGKGSAVSQFFDQNEYPIKLDQVSDRLDRLEANLKKATDAGYKAQVTFIDRGAEDAWNGVVGRAAHAREKGEIARTVPLDIAVKANIDARKTTIQLLEKSPEGVTVNVIDNTGMPGDRKIIDDRDHAIAYLKQRIASEDAGDEGRLDRLKADVLKRNASGEIADDITRGLVGHELTPSQLFDRIKQTGGATYQPVLANTPTEGNSVSMFPQNETVVSDKEMKASDVADYLKKNREMFKDKSVHFGAWHDSEKGLLYLDCVKTVSDPAEAESLAKKYNQEGYYNLKTHETVIVKKPEDRRGGITPAGPEKPPSAAGSS